MEHATNCVIEVDIGQPQNICEVIITNFANMEYEGQLWNGYKIMLQADACQFQDDWYEAQQLSFN